MKHIAVKASFICFVLLSISRVESSEHVYTNTVVPPFSVEISQSSLTNGLISWSNIGTNIYAVEWSLDLESWFPLNAQSLTSSTQTIQISVDIDTDHKMFRVKRIIDTTYILSGIISNSTKVLTNYSVRLLDQSQQELVSTITSSTGEYTFPLLANGNYTIGLLFYNSTNTYYYSGGQVNGSNLTVDILVNQTMTLTSPTHNSVEVSTSPLFTWDPTEYASWYAITIYNSSQETVIESAFSFTTSYQTPLTLDNNQSYYWYILAYDINTNPIGFTQTGSFFTTVP